VQIPLPPLRARNGDVLILARAFLAQLATKLGRPAPDISAAAREKLLAYEWRGNVRELRNCMERAVALSRTEDIELADLPPRVRDYEARAVLLAANESDDLVPLEEVERRYILRVVEFCQGNKTVAAKILGLNRKTLHRRLEGITGSAASNETESSPMNSRPPEPA
jgi:two-component system response regulator HydG